MAKVKWQLQLIQQSFFQSVNLTHRYLIFSSILSLLVSGNVATPAKSQISADDSVSTQVNNSANIAEITAGTTRGNNLFHSFSEFSVAPGNTAFFNNAANVENIIGRVTGGSISTINGLIRANGNANLFLINPNGINFGANARLDIGGSFLGSTANSLVFEDGTLYSATDTNGPPLLTVSVPVGLQLGQNSGAINVQGTGHNLSLATPVFSPLTRGDVGGLKVKSGQTLALIGNNISLTGGTLTAESGKIELGSIETGAVQFSSESRGWTFNYDDVSIFNDINLAQEALTDASGSRNGSINFQGKQVSFTDGSAALIQNLEDQVGGKISVHATESLSIIGTETAAVIASGLYTETLGAAKGGDIEVVTRQLTIEEGASIISTTSSAAPGGNVTINATDNLRFVGFSQLNPDLFSVVSVQTFGAGNAGNVSVSTQNFTALDGANISSITGSPLGTGSGGNIDLVATESIELIGSNSVTLAPSQITAGSGSPGSAGNVRINTARLTIEDGARVDASATATGNAGNVMINASESVEVKGTFPGSLNPSLITASANILDQPVRELFGLPDEPSGNSGSIAINTPQLQIMNQGEVTVRNAGVGNAGNLRINADVIEISNEGKITGAVEEGVGGLIELSSNSLDLSNGGQILSDNRGRGDGGEIRINTNFLSISDRSFITTTTFGSGKGGDITLDVADSIDLRGTGFEEFQQAFQVSALDGTLKPGTRGTGIFIGTAANGTAGNLKIETDSLSLTEGGIIFSPIFTHGRGGNLTVEANDVQIIGSALQIGAGVNSTSSAQAGEIEVNTERLMIRDGGTILNGTFGNAKGGNIKINASESVNLQNTPDGSSLIFTGIYANTSRGSGAGGDVSLTTENLTIDDAFISSTTGGFIFNEGLAFEGGGDGGNIEIKVSDTISIFGLPSDPRFGSGVSSASFTDGDAGNIKITTSKLSIKDGSEIAATTIGSGTGGNLTIDATDYIELSGITTSNGIQRGGLITTSGRAVFPTQIASGASGNIEITTGDLTVQEGASIDVQSIGTGKAGNLTIEAADTILVDRGNISAGTNSNTGGNIKLTADNIFWRNNSATTATARNNANGGNIEIEANNLVALEASQLTAEAKTGEGGEININAQGLFICDECRVSASSQVGIDGVVNTNTLDPNSNLEIVDLPIQLTQPEEIVALACSGTQKPNSSKLTISGRGGLPPRPSELLTSESMIEVAESENQPQITKNNHSGANYAKLPTPAQSWYTNSQGELVLTANTTSTTNNKFSSPDCHVRRITL